MDEATNTYRVDASFKMLEHCLAQFAPQAPVPSAGDLRGHVEAFPSEHRQWVLVELIKADMAAAAELGMDRPIEFYLPPFADLLPPDKIPPDLVLEEIQLRREAGLDADWTAYRDRFPGLASTIGRLLAVGEPTARCEQVGELPALPLGQTVEDFHILKLLGEGAFARVYLARQESMQRLVALKTTLRGSDEPQALSQLDHLNIVRVFDQRSCASPPMRLLYMQYLPGGTLADCIRLAAQRPRDQWSGRLIIESIDRNLAGAGQLTPEDAPVRALLAEQDWPTTVAWIGVQLAEGLDYAHQREVLHRDVKPANILLSAEGLPKLADFNVSFSGVAGRAGAAANFGGSLAYMSPEQLRAADPTDDFAADGLDHRSDLFSLGVVLWELLRGERPWRLGSSFSNWSEALHVQKSSRQQALPPSEDSTAVGRVLDQVLRTTLAESRDHRPASGAAMAGALRLALHPAAAERFHPSPGSLAHWLSRVPPVLAISITALLPNLAAGVFNYVYNGTQIVAGYPALWPKFVWLAAMVNAVLFPLGLALGVWKMWPILRGSAAAKRDELPRRQELAVTWTIGHVIACISGVLWIIGGLIFPFALMAMEPEYRWSDAIHFFASLAICGGVAMTYPFFLVSSISVLCLYPQMVRPALCDPEFDARRDWLLRRSRQYLALAALVPLLALVLLAFRDHVPRVIVLATIGTTALGLLASFLAYQWMDDSLRHMAAILSPRQSLSHAGKQI